MNKQERIRPPRRDDALSPMSARAVALCEGCPMAAFCVIKTAAPCDTTDTRAARVEAGGEYERVALEMPVQASYRKELFDDAQPIVMAALQKKNVTSMPVKQATPRPVMSRSLPTQAPRPASAPAPRRPSMSRIDQPATAGIVADILASMIGSASIATARGKKGV